MASIPWATNSAPQSSQPKRRADLHRMCSEHSPFSSLRMNMDSVVVFFVRQFVGAAFRTMNERELYTFEGIFPKPTLATVLAMDVNHRLDVADTFARQDVNLLLRLGLTPM